MVSSTANTEKGWVEKKRKVKQSLSGVKSEETSQFLSTKLLKTQNSSFYIKILNGQLISIKKETEQDVFCYITTLFSL